MYLFMWLFIPSFDGSEVLAFCSIHDAAEIVHQKDTLPKVLLKRQPISNTTRRREPERGLNFVARSE